MKHRVFLGTVLLGGALLAFSACGDEADIIFDPPPTQAELNIQTLESYQIQKYCFRSESVLRGEAETDSYTIEYPYVVVRLLTGNVYRFDMNKLIAFSVIGDTLYLFFP